jgi:hypothetical protein
MMHLSVKPQLKLPRPSSQHAALKQVEVVETVLLLWLGLKSRGFWFGSVFQKSTRVLVRFLNVT